tara:strand:- start:685 stop:1020 length:336 start_codon:yes stop_codon:yes gene_type:complete
MSEIVKEVKEIKKDSEPVATPKDVGKDRWVHMSTIHKGVFTVITEGMPIRDKGTVLKVTTRAEGIFTETLEYLPDIQLLETKELWAIGSYRMPDAVKTDYANANKETQFTE